MRNWRNPVVLAAPLIIAGCFFLPNAVSGIADGKMLDSLSVIASQSVSYETTAELGLPERLALISNKNTDHLNLKKGKALEKAPALERTVTELESFFGGGGFEFDFENCKDGEGGAVFIIDSENPSKNLIVWEFLLYDADGRSISASLDEETGKLLQIQYRKSTINMYIANAVEPRNSKETAVLKEQNSAEDALRTSAELLAQMLTDYYGLQVSLGDYKFSGEFAYYRADLKTDGELLPLYGVMREYGFTVNERV